MKWLDIALSLLERIHLQHKRIAVALALGNFRCFVFSHVLKGQLYAYAANESTPWFYLFNYKYSQRICAFINRLYLVISTLYIEHTNEAFKHRKTKTSFKYALCKG